MKRSIGTALLTLGLLRADFALAQTLQNIVLRNSFSPIGAGARGLGMGGAFIAVADDGTAASFNPAGLAQLRRTELAVVGFSDDLTSTVSVPRPTGVVTSESSVRHGAIDFGGMAIPFEVGGRNLTIQASYQRSVDLFGQGKATVQDTIKLSEVDPSFSGTGDFIADITPAQSGAFQTASLSAGYQLTSRLALGATVNYWFGNWTAQGGNDFHLQVRGPGGRFVEVPLVNKQFNQKQSMHALSVNTGILLRYPRVSIGGIVRLPFTGAYELTENDSQVTFDQNGRPGSPVPESLGMKSQLDWPLSAGAGLALRPFKGLTLTGDYTWSQWSQTTIRNVPAGTLLTAVKTGPTGEAEDSFNDRNFFDMLPSSETSTSNTSTWRAGGEYLVVLSKLIVPLRGGFFRDRSPITELGQTQGKQIKGWTAGTGLNFSRFVLDVAFERQNSQGLLFLRLRQGQPVQSGTAASTEMVKEDRIVASLIYRFAAENDPLKRAFHSLFGSKGDEGH
jgi:long-chain fatty acid transport protein